MAIPNKQRAQSRKTIDCLLAICLILIMSTPLYYSEVHEIVGVLTIVLLAIHCFSGTKRLQVMLRRKSAKDIAGLVIDVCLLILLILMAWSSLVISEHVFSWLPNFSSIGTARKVHLAGSYWLFFLAFVHAGLHANEFLTKLRNDKNTKNALLAIFIASLIFGIYSFFDLQLFDYLFLKVEFAYVDNNVFLNLLRYTALAISAIGITASCRPKIHAALQRRKNSNHQKR